MSSIISTQENSNTSLVEAIKKKKEAKENKGVQFANVFLESFTDKSAKLIVKSQLLAQVNALKENSQTTNTQIQSITKSSLKEGVLATNLANSQIEYDENTINALNALIDSHKGNAGDYQKAKEFLLSLMDSLATEFWQKGFDTAELESFKKAYDEKLSDKNKLEEEIISKANDLLVENDDFKFKKLAESIALKLTAYTNATKTEVEDLYNFFSITMNYLKDDIKNDIAKALAIMENENISGINLNNGNVLTWRIDADGRVSFKILSQEQLQLSQETIQKAKTFQNMIEIFNQREKQTNANSDKNTLQALLKDIDTKEFDEIKI